MSYPVPIVIPVLIRQAFRYELDPNKVQRTALAKHAGTARYAYNWGLAEIKAMFDGGKGPPGAVAQHKKWNEYKRKNAPWWI